MIAVGTPGVMPLVPLSSLTVIPISSFCAFFPAAVSNHRPTVSKIRLTSFSKSRTLFLSRASSSSILLFPSELTGYPMGMTVRC
jgi:membrane protein YqaA with SNARE-associated domain